MCKNDNDLHELLTKADTVHTKCEKVTLSARLECEAGMVELENMRLVTISHQQTPW